MNNGMCSDPCSWVMSMVTDYINKFHVLACLQAMEFVSSFAHLKLKPKALASLSTAKWLVNSAFRPPNHSFIFLPSPMNIKEYGFEPEISILKQNSWKHESLINLQYQTTNLIQEFNNLLDEIRYCKKIYI